MLERGVTDAQFREALLILGLRGADSDELFRYLNLADEYKINKIEFW